MECKVQLCIVRAQEPNALGDSDLLNHAFFRRMSVPLSSVRPSVVCPFLCLSVPLSSVRPSVVCPPLRRMSVVLYIIYTFGFIPASSAWYGFWWNLVVMSYSSYITCVVIFRPDSPKSGSLIEQIKVTYVFYRVLCPSKHFILIEFLFSIVHMIAKWSHALFTWQRMRFTDCVRTTFNTEYRTLSKETCLYLFSFCFLLTPFPKPHIF